MMQGDLPKSRAIYRKALHVHGLHLKGEAQGVD